MAQVNFNDKSGGDYVQAGEINALKNAINTNEGLVTNGSVSGYFDSNNHFRYNHHFIPESNSNFDLGSAEYKVRHLFLSDNSLWIGDQVKIGQTLCIIESMKIMNEIESEQSGTIKKILVNNSDPVEFNQPLFIIE